MVERCITDYGQALHSPAPTSDIAWVMKGRLPM